MSNRRRPARDNTYRTNYLHSGAWFARRDRWFLEEGSRNGTIRCALCLGTIDQVLHQGLPGLYRGRPCGRHARHLALLEISVNDRKAPRHQFTEVRVSLKRCVGLQGL